MDFDIVASRRSILARYNKVANESLARATQEHAMDFDIVASRGAILERYNRVANESLARAAQEHATERPQTLSTPCNEVPSSLFKNFMPPMTPSMDDTEAILMGAHVSIDDVRTQRALNREVEAHSSNLTEGQKLDREIDRMLFGPYATVVRTIIPATQSMQKRYNRDGRQRS